MLCLLLVTGCASNVGRSAGGANGDKGLLGRIGQAVGLGGEGSEQPTADSESLKALAQKLEPAKRRVVLRLHAAQRVNVDGTGEHSLALVVRLYRLRSPQAFLEAPYAAFQGDVQAPLPFQADVVSVRELVLRPGQQIETLEDMPAPADHLGVVALFRAPADGRWRFAFESRAATQTGVTLGLHGCAMSVALGQPIGVPAESLRVAGVRCR